MKTKYIISFLLIVFIFNGCTDDWVSLENPNDQTTATFWKTESDIERGVNAAYMCLLYDGTWMRFTPFALNLKADDIYSPSPWAVLSLVGQFNKFVDDPIMERWLWTAFFSVNNKANLVLAHIDDAEFTNEAKRGQYKGEALFLRAFANFYLLNFFHNIPLVLTPYESDDDLYPYQADPADVWASIYADFEEASNLLPATPSEVGRATKGAALAFLGKSYLYNEEYETASGYFEQVMDLGYSLVANYEDNFTTLNENNSESIFEIQLDRNVGGTDLGWVSAPSPTWGKTTAHAITFAPTPFGFGDVSPTQWIYDEFQLEQTTSGEIDPRCRVSLTYDYPGCKLYGVAFRDTFPDTRWNELMLRKYTNAYSDRENESDWRSDINERVMRYAEVLMMYAECQFELNGAAAAAPYIQQVRNRVNLPDITSKIANMDRTGFYNQLAHEKALEFCFEGIRFDDIRRWGWLQDTEKLAELKAHDTEYNGYIAGREYFPIPLADLDRNDKYKQNPGW
jgi:starch-binding outer membrane protein, SusD/RagB family